YVSLLKRGIHIRGITFDMLLASYLLNPGESHHSIPDIAQRMNKSKIMFDEEVYGKGAKLHVPEQSVLAEHVVRKTKLLAEMEPEMNDLIRENEQYDLLKESEKPLASILGEMEYTRIKIDTAHLDHMGTPSHLKLKRVAFLILLRVHTVHFHVITR